MLEMSSLNITVPVKLSSDREFPAWASRYLDVATSPVWLQRPHTGSALGIGDVFIYCSASGRRHYHIPDGVHGHSQQIIRTCSGTENTQRNQTLLGHRYGPKEKDATLQSILKNLGGTQQLM